MINNITPTVKQLLIINIMVFVGSYFIKDLHSLFALYNLQDSHFRIWQLITHMFMHATPAHIFFNMFALFSFGSMLEQFWGPKKFLFFYISCGLGAALMQLGINYLEVQHFLNEVSGLNLSPATLKEILNATLGDGVFYNPEIFRADAIPILQSAGKFNGVTENDLDALFAAAKSVQVPMVGASGAIYGLLVAFAFMFPTAEMFIIFIPIPVKAKYFVPGIIAVDLISGIYGSSIFGDNAGGGGVAHFAHIGGAIIGFIMMWYWKKTQFNNRRWN